MATRTPLRYDSDQALTPRSLPGLVYLGIMLLIWTPVIVFLAQPYLP